MSEEQERRLVDMILAWAQEHEEETLRYLGADDADDADDAGTPYTCAVLGCTHASLTDAQRVHGICSVLDCDEPIQGWCAQYSIKVCAPVHGGRDRDGTFRCQRCHWGERRDQPTRATPM